MRVGTSTCRLEHIQKRQDHPHACGDKTDALKAVTDNTGSSPCVWGQALEGVSFDNCDRIIPMRVGTRCAQAHQARGDWDHPHACGDKDCECIIDGYKLGSSPCVWGQVCFYLRSKPIHRIIPMRVGTRIKRALCGSPY